MISFPILSKARSGLVKSSHENWVAGNGGFVEEQNHLRQIDPRLDLQRRPSRQAQFKRILRLKSQRFYYSSQVKMTRKMLNVMDC
ncbi:hypothetical protein V6N13_105017 [Hibiscus sabdariffa]|uniref:Uncharacterized protein n=1 Tax=Hibiscus sabdariffa TaxID=183260 RepID=A0ABR2SJR6_9ROSI